MVIIVSIFADKDFEYSVDSYRYTVSPDKFSFDDIIADAQKRFGDTYSGINIQIRKAE
jgi:hypothetical protein